MKTLAALFLLASNCSIAAVSNPEKSAEDLCEMEWRITDRSGSTATGIPQIVDEEVAAFKASGYSLSDFSIDEKDFVKVSTEGALNFRKMLGQMSTPYAEAKNFFRERMVPLCIKNVLESTSKKN